jgi:hypothetical protein
VTYRAIDGPNGRELVAMSATPSGRRLIAASVSAFEEANIQALGIDSRGFESLFSVKNLIRDSQEDEYGAKKAKCQPS